MEYLTLATLISITQTILLLYAFGYIIYIFLEPLLLGFFGEEYEPKGLIMALLYPFFILNTLGMFIRKIILTFMEK